MFDELVGVARTLVRPKSQFVVGRENFGMVPAGRGWPVRVHVASDAVRVRTGSGSTVSVAAEDDSLLELIEQIIVAIQNGDAEEYYGIGTDGDIHIIGYRVWFAGGAFLALDESVEVLATHRAEAWEGSSAQ